MLDEWRSMKYGEQMMCGKELGISYEHSSKTRGSTLEVSTYWSHDGANDSAYTVITFRVVIKYLLLHYASTSHLRIPYTSINSQLRVDFIMGLMDYLYFCY